MNEIASAEDDRRLGTSPRPSKRSRIDRDQKFSSNPDRQYRRRSPPRRGPHHGVSKSWSTDRGSYDSYKPSNDHQHRHTDRSQRHRSASPGQRERNDPEPRNKNKKSLRDRKQNPSTRIHSLRRMLSRGGLPATTHQEKERELAGLLFDQQKEIINKNAKKNLKRYHFIRFVERQKATRTVKRLKNLRESGDVSEDLEKQIHEAEVDFNYTVYCPLAQKYIAIYAREESEQGKPLPLARNLSNMPRADYAILSEEQKYHIEQASMEAANMLHMSDSVKGVKPPMWYIVEAKMQEGQKALEELRDEKPKVDPNTDLVIGKASKQTPDWLNDDGMIDPEDLDSESGGEGNVGVSGQVEDEEMSDADGGFFEKR